MIMFASPSFLVSSVWQSMFSCAQSTQMFPFFNFMRSAGPGRCLIVFTGFIHATMSQTALCLFHLSKGYFVGATTRIITILHALHRMTVHWQSGLSTPLMLSTLDADYGFTQPSSRTFWLMALSVNSEKRKQLWKRLDHNKQSNRAEVISRGD